MPQYRQIVVRQLKLGNAVLVVQRDGIRVVNRLLEVVDRDVISKDFLRPFFPGDQWRSHELDERCVRESVPHVQDEYVVLAPVSFIRDEDNIVPGLTASGTSHLPQCETSGSA